MRRRTCNNERRSTDAGVDRNRLPRDNDQCEVGGQLEESSLAPAPHLNKIIPVTKLDTELAQHIRNRDNVSTSLFHVSNEPLAM